jgi:hypothetical protein
MKKVLQSLKAICKDESAQGMTEYVLIVLVVVTVAAIFRDQISSAVKSKMQELSTSINSFSGSGS